MWYYFFCFLLSSIFHVTNGNIESNVFNYPNMQDDVFDQPVNMMAPAKNPHSKISVFEQADNMMAPAKNPHTEMESSINNLQQDENVHVEQKNRYSGLPYDWPSMDSFFSSDDALHDYNRIKRRAKKRRNRVSSRRRNHPHSSTTSEATEVKNVTSTEVPVARRADVWDLHQKSSKRRRYKNKKDKQSYETYEPAVKDWESTFVEMPKDLYQAHLRPGVIFRIHMAEAILKMQYRNYGEDKDESVIEADVEYLRLTRKVINDEITKFEDLKWLIGWFSNRSDLIQEHMCNTRYYTVGIPPTMFTHPEEYMKRACLFDNVYLDHIPYVVGEDGSLMAAVAPPVLHCDAATCTSVPFIDSMMFEEKLSRSNVRTVTRCQASCRAHCRNDADCLKSCSERCFRAD